MANPMMACGHSASFTVPGEDGEERRVCYPCYSVSDPRSWEVVETPDLTGRKALCQTCGTEADSSPELPFFSLGDGETDLYYCGCLPEE